MNNATKTLFECELIHAKNVLDDFQDKLKWAIKRRDTARIELIRAEAAELNYATRAQWAADRLVELQESFKLLGGTNGTAS